MGDPAKTVRPSCRSARPAGGRPGQDRLRAPSLRHRGALMFVGHAAAAQEPDACVPWQLARRSLLGDTLVLPDAWLTRRLDAARRPGLRGAHRPPIRGGEDPTLLSGVGLCDAELVMRDRAAGVEAICGTPVVFTRRPLPEVAGDARPVRSADEGGSCCSVGAPGRRARLPRRASCAARPACASIHPERCAEIVLATPREVARRGQWNVVVDISGSVSTM